MEDDLVNNETVVERLEQIEAALDFLREEVIKLIEVVEML